MCGAVFSDGKGEKMNKKIERCQFCGNKEEYFIKTKVSGSTRCSQRFDGVECDNGDMYEPLKYENGKYAYCKCCGKRIFNLETGNLCGVKD